MSASSRFGSSGQFCAPLNSQCHPEHERVGHGRASAGACPKGSGRATAKLPWSAVAGPLYRSIGGRHKSLPGLGRYLAVWTWMETENTRKTAELAERLAEGFARS